MTLLVILFGREREVRLGNQIHANKECDKTTYDLKLERGGVEVGHALSSWEAAGVSCSLDSLEIIMAA